MGRSTRRAAAARDSRRSSRRSRSQDATVLGQSNHPLKQGHRTTTAQACTVALHLRCGHAIRMGRDLQRGEGVMVLATTQWYYEPNLQRVED